VRAAVETKEGEDPERERARRDGKRRRGLRSQDLGGRGRGDEGTVGAARQAVVRSRTALRDRRAVKGETLENAGR